ncbi:hypothetical protein PoB_003119500 [Plakobranchus ocellatus]|uniref:Uncharacterized protein n=1 Tax=Plakobranchus ocellatus TaxID=259542 RepID=A0AAV4A955_9GAST|nr:hypothetical protein PoB_003119500 [Plakobranchus ocellatus]
MDGLGLDGQKLEGFNFAHDWLLPAEVPGSLVGLGEPNHSISGLDHMISCCCHRDEMAGERLPVPNKQAGGVALFARSSIKLCGRRRKLASANMDENNYWSCSVVVAKDFTGNCADLEHGRIQSAAYNVFFDHAVSS